MPLWNDIQQDWYKSKPNRNSIKDKSPERAPAEGVKEAEYDNFFGISFHHSSVKMEKGRFEQEEKTYKHTRR